MRLGAHADVAHKPRRLTAHRRPPRLRRAVQLDARTRAEAAAAVAKIGDPASPRWARSPICGRLAARTVCRVIRPRRRTMQTYVILRRSGWATGKDLADAAARSTAEGDQMPDDIRWIRSYVLEERDGAVGTVCIYQASSPEAIREHARRADLPADEIISVADVVTVRPDPEP